MKRNFSDRQAVSRVVVAIVVVVIIVIAAAGTLALTIKPATTTGPTTLTVTTTAVTTSAVTTTATSAVTTTATSAVTTTATTTQAPVTLTVWDTYAPGSGEFTAFNKTIADFNMVYPWITLNIQTQPFNSAEADFITAALANQAPDVLRVSNDWTGPLVAQGFIQPIDSFVNSTFMQQYSNASTADYTFNGHLYGLGENINGLALIYNKALFTAAGLSGPPTTTDQLLSDAQALLAKNASTIPIIFPANNGYWWYPFLFGFGGQIFQSGTVPPTPLVNSTAAVDATMFLNKLVNDGYMPPQPSDSDMTSAFTSGQAAMIIDGPWDVSTWTAVSGLEWAVAPLPTVSNTSLPIAPTWGSQGWEISSDLPAHVQQAAFDFISYVTTASAQANLFTYAGDLPTSTTLASSSTITSNSTFAGFVLQEATAGPLPNSPQMGDTWTPVGNALAAAEPTSPTQVVTSATIQSQLNGAETSIITAEG